MKNSAHKKKSKEATNLCLVVTELSHSFLGVSGQGMKLAERAGIEEQTCLGTKGRKNRKETRISRERISNEGPRKKSAG